MNTSPLNQEHPSARKLYPSVVGDEGIDLIQKTIWAIVVRKWCMDLVAYTTIQRGVHITPEGSQQVCIVDNGCGGREKSGIVIDKGSIEWDDTVSINLKNACRRYF